MFFNNIKNVPSIGFPHKFSILAQKANPQGLVDAPDPQEAESGRERQRLVQFSIFWSQMVAFGYVPLLDYAGLKNLNVWSLRTPLMMSLFMTHLSCSQPA